MHILIGLGVAVALLYAWLVGWWFARLLVFLGLAFVGLLIGFAMANPNDAGTASMVALALAVVSWLVASVPTYIYRAMERQPG